MANNLNAPSYRVPKKDGCYAGRLALHENNKRTEEMFYFLCLKWEYLADLLENPFKFFSDSGLGTSDTLSSPVVAVLKPASKDLARFVQGPHGPGPYQPGPLGAEAGANESNDLPPTQAEDQDISPYQAFFSQVAVQVNNEFLAPGDRNANDDLNESGWFFAEFANLTHVLTIYYHSPRKFNDPSNTYEPTYLNGYQEVTVCHVGDSHCQIHFDLKTGSEVDQPEQGLPQLETRMEILRARFIVDYLTDNGASMSRALTTQMASLKSTDMVPVFNGAPNPVKPHAQTDMNAISTRRLRAGLQVPGPTLIVEGLMPWDPNGVADDPPTETFVCLQNQGYVEGHSYVLADGTVKVYTAGGAGNPMKTIDED